jgi:hypothetical protein
LKQQIKFGSATVLGVGYSTINIYKNKKLLVEAPGLFHFPIPLKLFGAHASTAADTPCRSGSTEARYSGHDLGYWSVR